MLGRLEWFGRRGRGGRGVVAGRVVVVGNASWNVILDVLRLPTDGETVVALQRREDLGGKGLNQAVAAARAGARVGLVARIGDDAVGAQIRACLAREGIDARFLVVDAQPTNCSYVTVAADGTNRIVSLHAPAAALASAATQAIAALDPGDRVLMQGNVEHGTACAVVEAARARAVPVTLNAASLRWPLDAVLGAVETLVVNEAEARALAAAPPEAAARLLLGRGPALVLVTLGAAGVLVATGAGVETIAAPPAAAIDTVGAGDVFCGCHAAFSVAGLDRDTGLRRAVAAASLSVTRQGTLSAFPTSAEIASLG